MDEKGEIAAKYGVSSTPVKFLIDTEGNMAGAAMGFKKWDSDEIKALLETLMEPRK